MGPCRGAMLHDNAIWGHRGEPQTGLGGAMTQPGPALGPPPPLSFPLPGCCCGFFSFFGFSKVKCFLRSCSCVEVGMCAQFVSSRSIMPYMWKKERAENLEDVLTKCSVMLETVLSYLLLPLINLLCA